MDVTILLHGYQRSGLLFSWQLDTVVQHVKHFSDVVEFGENQKLTGDNQYLLSDLKCTQPLNT